MRAILQQTSELTNLVKEQQKQMIEQQEQHNKQITRTHTTITASY